MKGTESVDNFVVQLKYNSEREDSQLCFRDSLFRTRIVLGILRPSRRANQFYSLTVRWMSNITILNVGGQFFLVSLDQHIFLQFNYKTILYCKNRKFSSSFI